MKNNFKLFIKIFCITSLSIGIVIFFVIFIISKLIKEDITFQELSLANTNGNLDLRKFFNFNSGQNITTQFPYVWYSNSDNWKSITDINKDLKLLDTYNSDLHENRMALSEALTTNLNVWKSNDLDSLNLLFNWADNFRCTITNNSEDQLFYDAVYGYWMDYIAGVLKRLSKKNDVKYLFKYKYMRERCAQANYSIGESNDNVTKVINYVIENRWYYLIVERMWRSTSIGFKIILFSIITISTLGFCLIINKCIIK